MGKIFYIFGKSASGKDTIYKKLIEDKSLDLKGVVRYTTRPMREGEIDGHEYFFVTPEKIAEYEQAGKIIEIHTYQTVHGPWSYAMIDDGQVDLKKHDYIIAGVLSSYVDAKNYFGADSVIPLYVEVEDGERLQRALDREKQGNNKFIELCRRFLADSEDFSEENIAAAGITKRYYNDDFDRCVSEIKNEIAASQGKL